MLILAFDSDEAGVEVATTEVSEVAGVGHFFVELADLDTPPVFGDWTLTVAGLRESR